MEPRPIRVLFPPRRPTSNPYVVMLGEALAAHPAVELVDLTWKTALFGQWDVIHLHWPEILVSGRTAEPRRPPSLPCSQGSG
jgi:beta-1,4-mannosyltransferase